MPTAAKKNKVNFLSVRSVFFFTLIAVFGIGITYIFQPFLYPLFWATVIATLFYPTYSFIAKHTKLPSVSSALTILLVIAVLFIPLIGLSILLIQQSINLYTLASHNGVHITATNATTWIAQTPFASYQSLIQQQFEAHAGDIAKYISTFIVSNVTVLTQASAIFIFQFCIMMYALYYFLKDGKRMLVRLMHLSPLGDTYEQLLFDKFISTSRATLKSTVIVGGVQGLLGGFLFWVSGIPAPVVWGIIMTLFCMVPSLGSGFVWLPATIIMLLLGDTQAAILLLIGGSIISLVDNVIRPPLVGRDTQMHPLVILLSTLGGIFLFGISGFIIGPILAALFIATIDMYDHYYKDELMSNLE